jgi:NADPH:quinone reductase-like Zn-dependent oxidoreductase
MRAAVHERFGPPDVVEIRDLEKPVPRDGEILIRIRATTVTSADHRARSLDVPAGFGPLSRLVFGVFGPRQRVLGAELAGDVETIGKGVQSFRAGDAVFAFTGAKMGCHAEYRCIPADGLVAPKPPQLSYEEAAAIPFGGVTALHFLRKGKLVRGEKVLVNGASGAVGTACVQLARHLGAEVTGVCGAAHAGLVRSLGAADVIDYMQEDFTRNGRTYDVIVDTAGTAPLSRCKSSLGARGRLLLINASLPDALRSAWGSLRGDKKVIAGVALGTRDDLRSLASLVEAGELKPVVDRCYPLERIVDAHRYVDTGHKGGSVAVALG